MKPQEGTEIYGERVYNKATHWSAPLELVDRLVEQTGRTQAEVLEMLGLCKVGKSQGGNVDLGGR
jgi:hypothetical protein